MNASDADGDELLFSADGLPEWLGFDAETGVLSGMPQDDDAGETADIILSVSDGGDTTPLAPFRLDVMGRAAPPAPPASDNQPPAISGAPAASVQATTAYSFRPVATDPDSPRITFTVANKPAWAAFSTRTGTLSGTPAASQAGTYSGIVISARDGVASTALPAFTITVTAAPNRAPVISGTPATTVAVGSSYSFTPLGSDPERQSLTFSIANRPAWASFSSTTGRLSGAPGSADVRNYPEIVISVSDGSASRSLAAFTLAVTTVPNDAPRISGQPQLTATSGAFYNFAATTSDADGDTLSFSATGLPEWARLDAQTGVISGTPQDDDVGASADIALRVSDGKTTVALPRFRITVAARAAPPPPPPAPSNRPPVIGGTPATTVQATTAYSFRPVVSDPDSSRLTFSITNRPSWAAFSATTGTLSGTPTAGQTGTWSGITITVSDGAASASLPAFRLVVTAAPNGLPVIRGTPATSVTAGSSYSFTPVVSDPDGQAMGFSIANKPVWATFNIGTGRLSGTPTNADARSYPGIVISVSDGSASVALPAFALNVVAAPNVAPTISGTPATSVAAGSSYRFAPTAQDGNGDELSFNISGRPVWASFNSTTGLLSGTPGAGHAGSYNGITISVSDGSASRSLPAFNISVPASTPPISRPTTGFAMLSWSAPSRNTDGSTLTNLAGYRIYYGSSPDSLRRTYEVASATTTTFRYENLVSGTHYFAVTAYLTTGTESALSGVGSKTVP